MYLDHNVLDALIKQRMNEFRVWLLDSPVIPIVSNTNLLEIKLSRGYEDEFMILLNEIKAGFIEEIYDDNFNCTDQYCWYQSDEIDLNTKMNLVQDEYEGPPVGFSGMIHKMYGGQPTTSYADILDKQMEDLRLEFDSNQHFEDDSVFTKQMNMLSEMALNAAQVAIDHLKNSLESEMAKPENVRFQQYQQTAPRVINNLEGENLIDKVIHAAVEEFDKIDEYSADDYLRQLNEISIETHRKENTVGGKIRTLYMLLSMFGYQREPKIKTETGFRKDMRDMEHVIMSRYCRLFFTDDRRLMMKANPIYHRLNLATKALSPYQHPHICFEFAK